MTTGNNVVEEMRKARNRLPELSRSELILGARWSAAHPDTSKDYRRTISALLEEIDLGKRRLRVAISYAAKLRSQV